MAIKKGLQIQLTKISQLFCLSTNHVRAWQVQ